MESLIIKAACEGNQEQLDLLISQNEFTEQQLQQAAFAAIRQATGNSDHDTCLGFLLEQIPSSPDFVDQTNGRTLLMEASKLGLIKLVQLLLDFNSDIQKKDYKKKTALFHAIESSPADDVDVVQVLLEKTNKRDEIINYQDDEGRTPLHAAVLNNKIDCIKKLLEYQADCNKQDKNNETPLNYAEKQQNMPIIEILKQSRVDLNKDTKKKQKSNDMLAKQVSNSNTNKESSTLIQTEAQNGISNKSLPYNKDKNNQYNLPRKESYTEECQFCCQKFQVEQKQQMFFSENQQVKACIVCLKDQQQKNQPMMQDLQKQVLVLTAELDEATLYIKELQDKIKDYESRQIMQEQQFIESNNPSQMKETPQKDKEACQSLVSVTQNYQSGRQGQEQQTVIEEKVIVQEESKVTTKEQSIQTSQQETQTYIKQETEQSNLKQNKETSQEHQEQITIVEKQQNSNLQKQLLATEEKDSQTFPISIIEAQLYLDPQKLKQTKQIFMTKNISEMLTNEIFEFQNVVKTNREQMKPLREKVIYKVKKVVEKIDPTAVLRIFGSHATELTLIWSDIDIVIQDGNFQNILQNIEKALKTKK